MISHLNITTFRCYAHDVSGSYVYVTKCRNRIIQLPAAGKTNNFVQTLLIRSSSPRSQADTIPTQYFLLKTKIKNTQCHTTTHNSVLFSFQPALLHHNFISLRVSIQLHSKRKRLLQQQKPITCINDLFFGRLFKSCKHARRTICVPLRVRAVSASTPPLSIKYSELKTNKQ